MVYAKEPLFIQKSLVFIKKFSFELYFREEAEEIEVLMAVLFDKILVFVI